MRKPMWTCWPQWEIRTPTLTQRNSYVYRQWYHRDAVPDLWVEGRSRATEYIVYWGQTILAQWIRLLDPIVDASFHTLWRVDGITIEIPSVISNLSNLTRKIATVVRCWSFWLHIYIYIKKNGNFNIYNRDLSGQIWTNWTFFSAPKTIPFYILQSKFGSS